MWKRTNLYLLLLILYVGIVKSQKNIKFLVLLEDGTQSELQNKFASGIAKAQSANSGYKFEMVPIKVARDDEDGNSFNNTCDVAKSQSFSAIVDLTWGGWHEMKMEAQKNGMPYVRLEGANHQFVKAADQYLHDREAIDAALIFKTESELDQSLYWLIGNSYIRVIVVNLEESDALDRLAKMRPSPSYYIAHGTKNTIQDIYGRAKSRNLAKRDSRWTFVFHDWNAESFPKSQLSAQVTFMQMTGKDCCVVKNEPGSSCSCGGMSSPAPIFVENAAHLVSNAFVQLEQSGKSTTTSFSCGQEKSDKSAHEDFMSEMKNVLSSSQYILMEDKALVTYPLKMDVVSKNATSMMDMGTWSTKMGFEKESGYSHATIPRFFRIGTVPTTPWAFYELDSRGMVMKDQNGNPMLKGYCLDMIEEMAKKMYFEYEVILPTDNSEGYGSKNPDGTWSGVIGDLVKGEIDIAVAGMTMTSEREEVVDFVAPYFDQSGISIIIREPVRARSLFKFMEVLRVEVWLAILAALIVTALMLWFLDRFSPYSARNNKEAHPYPCRVFTLKESFWFALTSFTPQGGGEAPKSLSGRVLVAAYWLFVVLMLATFTANLAAFLTVERMQTTVAGLDELAQQSKINYTVVDGSPYYEYFKNMASAEEDLYKKWKDMTLSSNADQARYRVWDYPIKEQYTHIYKTIKASGMMRSAGEGFQKVLDTEDGTFAFIHDASQVRYEYYNNCNYTEVGEPFAEQPYAVAVQQGSHLQEEISKVILELQKDRYFETLSSKYWNSTLRSLCPTLDDSEGITLRSLGGVFIATLVGLGIAMIVLAFEVYFHKKDQKNAVQDISRGSGGNAGHLQTNFNSSFGTGGDKTTMQVGGRILTVSSKNTEKAGFGGQFD